MEDVFNLDDLSVREYSCGDYIENDMSKLTYLLIFISKNFLKAIELVNPWLPNSSENIRRKMLDTIGVRNIDELFNDIPREIKIKKSLNVGLGKPLSESEVKRFFESVVSENKASDEMVSFLGAGCWPHYVPALVKALANRAEFYTAYTPYQPEVSQGILQAIFEYQSIMAELLNLDVVNASMYDGATALAEAILMSIRITGKNAVIVPSTINPSYLRVIRTWLQPRSTRIVQVRFSSANGQIDLEDLKMKSSNEFASVVIENPTYLGLIETQLNDIAQIAHDNKAILISCVEPISLGVLKAPGDYDADIAVGDGQPLGQGLNFGGPTFGFFACKWNDKFIRQMPGRIIGLTVTEDGKDEGYAMVSQTREQHIRRERATSSICTNETLCAVAAGIYLSMLGPSGLRKLCETILYNSYYAMKKLSEISGVKTPLFNAPHFKEFTVQFSGKTVYEIHEKLLSKYGVHGGKTLKEEFPELGETALYCVTEMHSKNDIDRLTDAIKTVLEVG